VRKNGQGGYVLSDTERVAVAMVLAAEAIETNSPLWEDAPLFAEDEWNLINDALNDVAVSLRRRAESTAHAASILTEVRS
jgi:hypothetical protein